MYPNLTSVHLFEVLNCMTLLFSPNKHTKARKIKYLEIHNMLHNYKGKL